MKAMEKALAIGNIIFLSCFLLQFLAMPKQIFNLATDYLEIGRFTMMGQMITYFSLFYYYNKYLFEKKTLSNFRNTII